MDVGENSSKRIKMAQPQIGLFGLAVMGQNLALNIAEHGVPIAVCNRSPSKVRLANKQCFTPPASQAQDPRLLGFVYACALQVDDTVKRAKEEGDLPLVGYKDVSDASWRAQTRAPTQRFHLVAIVIGARIPSPIGHGCIACMKPRVLHDVLFSSVFVCCDWLTLQRTGVRYSRSMAGGIRWFRSACCNQQHANKMDSNCFPLQVSAPGADPRRISGAQQYSPR